MKNILFSATRQWTVGDEFILFGAINLMKAVFPEGINPILYNRHPDLRTDCKRFESLRDIKMCGLDEASALADANFRLGFRDNSIKATTDAGFIDLVVFAGSPEWSNERCRELYNIIEKYNIPTIALGIGNNIQVNEDYVMRNLSRFQIFTVRAAEFIPTLEPHLAVKPRFLPCPAICSANPGMLREVKEVKHIGLVYACDVSRSEVNNCVSEDTYKYMVDLYREIRRKYSDCRISLVCHYIDELPFAYSDFPDMDVLYSFDSKDYYSIYNQFDLVIGGRVHGIGCAASMGIPGIAVAHDFRGNTAKGFQAELISVNQEMEKALELVDEVISTINARSKMLAEHIESTKESYISLFDGFKLKTKDFSDYAPALLFPTNNVFQNLPALYCAFEDLKDSEMKSKEKVIQEQQEMIYALYNSTSWKITAPLRKTMDVFKKLLKERD